MSESKVLEPSFFSYLRNLQDFKSYCEKAKQEAELEVKKIIRSDLKNEDLLQAVDEVNSRLTIAFQHLEASELIHPEKEVRDYISKTMPSFYYLPDYTLTFSLLENKDLHTKLKQSVSQDSLDQESKFFFEKIMLAYKINGINLGPQDSKRLKNLRLKCRELESKFALNIAENIPTLYFKEEELKGVPEDIIKSNKQKDGQIKLKLISNNKIAVLTQCEIKATREKVAEESGKYAKPLNKNITVQFLKVTKEIGNICGFKNYAELAMSTKMIKDPKSAEKFIKDLKDLSSKRLTKEIEAIKKVKLSFGDKSKLSKTDRTYYGERLVEKISGLKEEELRPYFPYKHVKEEILRIFSEMFSITFEREEITEVWNKEIETYLVKSNNKLLGRIHLDMHPRDGKYTHACQTDIRRGKKGGNLSEAILVCNFNKPDNNSDGLQSIDDVETFFHEFGHLLHEVLGTQNNKYYGLGGTSVQWDFVEAPSQLLEEIIKDKGVAKRLSSHHKTGKQIPDDLIKKMLDQGRPLRASFISGQAAFSKISLSLFLNENPSISEIEKEESKIIKEHLQTNNKIKYFSTYSFGHAIGNYYSNYYTYMWSLAISKDLFTKFNKKNLLDKKVAEHYRKTILEPGGSKPAAELVKDFLGREWNMDAFKEYLKEGEELLSKI